MFRTFATITLAAISLPALAEGPEYSFAEVGFGRVDLDVLDTSVLVRAGIGDGGDLAEEIAGQLAARGALCDPAPCIGGPECNADLNNDGVVNSGDLAILLAAWGACP